MTRAPLLTPPLPSEEGFKLFFLKVRPGPGLDCFISAIFARQGRRDERRDRRALAGGTVPPATGVPRSYETIFILEEGLNSQTPIQEESKEEFFPLKESKHYLLIGRGGEVELNPLPGHLADKKTPTPLGPP